MLLPSLEIKRTSITRLKRSCFFLFRPFILSWNQKNLDYEIETIVWWETDVRETCTWNQKNLDYEIETATFTYLDPHRSISLKSKEPRLRDWNSRWSIQCWRFLRSCLEIKRTSITRLKRAWADRLRSVPSVAWNQKNLDYEIETILQFGCWVRPIGTWNQKNLDYEIETLLDTGWWMLWPDLKSKEPRLRDWNYKGKLYGG